MSAPWFSSIGALASGTGNIAPALPAGYQDDDILVLVVETANEAVATPAGWTEITNSPQGTGVAADVAATRLTAFWKRASGVVSAPTITDAGDHTIGIIFAVAGCITTGDPFEDAAGDVEATGSTSVTWPSVTTASNDCLIVQLLAHNADISTVSCSGYANSALHQLTERFDDGQTAGNGGCIIVSTGVKGLPGSTGNTTATLSTSAAQGRLTLALKPPAGGYVTPQLYSSPPGSSIGTPDIPSSYAAGDIFLLLVETSNEAVAAPAGWTEVTNSPQGTGTAVTADATRLTAFWRRATASESDPVITNPSDHGLSQILGFRYCKASGDPFEATSGDVAASSTSVTMPDVTSLTDSALIVLVCTRAEDTPNTIRFSGWTNANLVKLAEHAEYATANGDGGGFAVVTGEKHVAGAVGTTSATLSVASAQARLVLALAPDTGGGGAGDWVPRIIGPY